MNYYDEKVGFPVSAVDRIRTYRLSPRMKQTILSVLIWGVLAHLYMYMNRIVNHDAVYSLRSFGSTITSGRWMITLLDEIAFKFHNHYVTPWGIGSVTLLIYAASACVLVKIFGIRSRPLCWVLGALLVTYPTVTSNNLYIFTAHIYALAFLLVCLSVLLLTCFRGLPSFAGSSLLIACSLGLYQAYLPFLLSTYVLLVMLRCLRAETETADILRMALKFLASLAAGLALYLLISYGAVRLIGDQLDEYMGLSTMGRLELSAIPAILRKCYSSFFGLFRENYHAINHKPWLRLTMLLCCLFSVGAAVFVLLKNRIRPLHILFTGAAFLLFPIAIGAIYIMTQAEDAVCTMTIYSTIFIFIIPICLADQLSLHLNVNRAFVVRMGLCLILGIVSFYYSTLANETYLAMEYTNQNITAYFTELATQIKSLDGFSPELEVAFLGDNTDESIPTFEFDYIIRGSYSPDRLINTYSRGYFMTMHCGYACTFVEDTQFLEQDDRVKAMPTYPASGSICIIDDVIVVKFS